MPLTVKVTIDDEIVQRFVDLFNEDSGTNITTDMVYHNSQLLEAIATDMGSFWFQALEHFHSLNYDEHVSTYDLYNEFFPHTEVVTLPEDRPLGNTDSHLLC